MTKQRLIWGILVVWLGIYAWSITALLTTPPEGDGFTRGMNRLTTFASWQLAAGFLGLFIWRLGQVFERGSVARWLSRLPILLAFALLLGIAGVIAAAFLRP